jgi:hypothetical protein
MSQATQTITTFAGSPPTGDALLIAQAAEYRAAEGASDAFHDACCKSSGKLQNHLGSIFASHEGRAEALLDSIFCMPTGGPHGLAIQLARISHTREVHRG